MVVPDTVMRCEFYGCFNGHFMAIVIRACVWVVLSIMSGLWLLGHINVVSKNA